MERFNAEWLERFLAAKTQHAIEAVGRTLDGPDEEMAVAVKAVLREVFLAAAE